MAINFCRECEEYHRDEISCIEFLDEELQETARDALKAQRLLRKLLMAANNRALLSTILDREDYTEEEWEWMKRIVREEKTS